MGTVLAIASVALALVAAGCIAFIAWELTSEALRSSEGDRSDDESD